MTEVGHNSRKTRVGGIDSAQLRSVIERVEKLEEEKAAIAADIRDVYLEAKGNGLCPKTIRQIVKLRKMDAHDRDEQETVLDTYRRAIGLLPQLELFNEEGEEA